MNEYLIESNRVADVTIFVSEWLKDLFIKKGIKKDNLHTIKAGANREFFNSNNLEIWNKNEKLRIVTHHWGTNKNKGYDVYEYIDKLISKEPWKNMIEFTFIGNLPKNYTFRDSKVIKPLYGKELGDELKKNHIYITGSLFEPSGNHHIEAAQCGLPILYLNSGGIPEFCKGFGMSFEKSEFFHKLEKIRSDYSKYSQNMKNYPFYLEKL